MFTCSTFCAEREANGRLLVCNSDGVLEFDSERWKLFKLPNREAVRSMAKGPTRSIWGLQPVRHSAPRCGRQLAIRGFEIHFKDRFKAAILPKFSYDRHTEGAFSSQLI